MKNIVYLSIRLSVSIFLGVALVSCGGGRAEQSNEPVSYVFATPKVGDQLTYASEEINSAQTPETRTVLYKDTVQTVNADGSYVFQRVDAGSSKNPVVTATYTVNKSGQLLSSVVSTTTSCTYSPHGAGPDYPSRIGDKIAFTYTSVCGGSSNAFTQNGSVVSVESVTVPAGTFSALKIQTELTWSLANGTNYTTHSTQWRDVKTGIPVKQVGDTTHTGTSPPTPYVTHAVRVLNAIAGAQ